MGVVAAGGTVSRLLVLQTDFGEKDGAVAEMRGVAYSVSEELRVEDLTHEIPAFDVRQAAYRLWQTAPYWPAGTVFVSVVDPGVGTERRSVVARANGQYFVTPDNGTLSIIARTMGIDAVREIDESVNRRPGSEGSHTFHGRDVYVYTGARLASGAITFEQVGPSLSVDGIVRLEDPTVSFTEGTLQGYIPVLDPQYGNVWTNITRADIAQLDVSVGDVLEVEIMHDGKTVWTGRVPFEKTFGDVPKGKPLLYMNSLDALAVALNQGNFAGTHGIGAGPGWTIRLQKMGSE